MTKKETENGDWINVNPVTKEVTIHAQKLYAHLKEHKHILLSERGNFYLYQYGKYRQLGYNEFASIIKEYLPLDRRTRKNWEMVLDEFKTDPPGVKEDDFNDDENIINFKNGILDLTTDELLKHDPKYLSTRQIPCDYNPDLTWADAPVFKEYIDSLVSGDGQDLDCLMQFTGAVISNVKGWRYKKLLILVGEGNTGKTQLRELVMRILGKENCISIDMAKIHERFGPALLYRKRLAGSGDMAYVELSEVNIIKNLTGGDSLFAEFKGKDGFSFRYDGFLWFNCNRLPFFRGDRGEHVYSRFLIVRCGNVIPEDKRDPHLIDKMMEEKEAIVSLAISYFKKTLGQYKFTEGESMESERHMYELQNNSLLTFVSECCILRPEPSGPYKKLSIRRSEFNSLYSKWCRQNMVKPERERDIGIQLEKHFGITAVKTNGIYEYPLDVMEEVKADLTCDDVLGSGQTGRGKYYSKW